MKGKSLVLMARQREATTLFVPFKLQFHYLGKKVTVDSNGCCAPQLDEPLLGADTVILVVQAIVDCNLSFCRVVLKKKAHPDTTNTSIAISNMEI